MTPPAWLEDFSQAPANLPDPLSGASEESALEAYERGYKSGWDDAMAEVTSKRSQVSDELERNLQNLNFTFQEAREDIAQRSMALLNDILEAVFPHLDAESTASALVSTLGMASLAPAAGRAELRVAPDDYDTVIDLLPGALPFDLDTQAEPALASGQALMRFETAEYRIDAAEVRRFVIEAVRTAATPKEVAEDEYRIAQ